MPKDMMARRRFLGRYTSTVPFLANGVQGPDWERPRQPSDAPPEEQISKAISVQTDVKLDAVPFRNQFGQAVENVRGESEPYRAGEMVWARFACHDFSHCAIMLQAW
ncbi:hypothetical protein B0H14DRAFT_3432793 [Mycena olivaceomarginata]|nr:hypothetical protein B0H14DRAFT_3432793 [Mycena olivaceomarginata]